jgi:hypothetical protein
MGKNNNGKKEEIKVEGEVKMEEVKNEEVKQEPAFETAEDMEMEMDEMELEMDGEEIQDEMEELIKERVEKDERDAKEQKHKRGPKPQTEEEKAAKKEKAPKKEKVLNLKDKVIQEREIKKGRLSAPQARIEKVESPDGNKYKLLLADGVIYPQDAKGNMKEIDEITKMNDGKYIITNLAAKNLGMDKFKSKHENGEEIEHDYVRVELHKPGRDKDVVMLFTVAEAKGKLREFEAQQKRKEEEAKKKAEKAAKDKAEKEKTAKEEKKAEETA